jgi:hypothetical protein
MGRGVSRDDAKAVSLYKQAAENGHAGAQCEFGAMYESGRGVAKDEEQAKAWYQKAAESALQEQLKKGETIETAIQKLISDIFDGLELFFPGNIPQIETWLAALEASPHAALAAPFREKLQRKLNGVRRRQKETSNARHTK